MTHKSLVVAVFVLAGSIDISRAGVSVYAEYKMRGLFDRLSTLRGSSDGRTQEVIDFVLQANGEECQESLYGIAVSSENPMPLRGAAAYQYYRLSECEVSEISLCLSAENVESGKYFLGLVVLSCMEPSREGYELLSTLIDKYVSNAEQAGCPPQIARSCVSYLCFDNNYQSSLHNKLSKLEWGMAFRTALFSYVADCMNNCSNTSAMAKRVRDECLLREDDIGNLRYMLGKLDNSSRAVVEKKISHEKGLVMMLNEWLEDVGADCIKPAAEARGSGVGGSGVGSQGDGVGSRESR